MAGCINNSLRFGWVGLSLERHPGAMRGMNSELRDSQALRTTRAPE